LEPRDTGGFEIDTGELRADIQRTFDGDGDARPVAEVVRATQLWIGIDELRSHGHTLAQVAEYLHRYTKGQNRRASDAVPEAIAAQRAFRTAFPTSILEELRCLGPASP
jgi:hypothetical protein